MPGAVHPGGEDRGVAEALIPIQFHHGISEHWVYSDVMQDGLVVLVLDLLLVQVDLPLGQRKIFELVHHDHQHILITVSFEDCVVGHKLLIDSASQWRLVDDIYK